jgi:hypothetical protein
VALASSDEQSRRDSTLPSGRHWLGWDQPALPAAVAWLRPYGEAVGWDLSELLLVVPAARAGRRLTELLVEAGGGALPGMPTLVTTGRLPEALITPDRPLAEPFQAMLARTMALRDAPPAQREPIVPRPPGENDWPAWWTLAEQCHQISTELAAHCLTPADVPPRCEQRGIELTQPERWQALAALEEAYQARLSDAGLTDPQAARLKAVRDQQCHCEKHVVLIATADLNPMVAAMLDQLDAPITALVHAPQEHAAGFDALGGLAVDYWAEQTVPIDPGQLRFVDGPSDQARAVGEAIGQAHDNAQRADGRGFAADQISVGLGDETQAGGVARTLEPLGLPVRYGPGRAVTSSPPALLLSALGRFAAERRFDALAELLRHPDIEAYLPHAAPSSHATNDSHARVDETSEGAHEPANELTDAREHWLVLLDRYASEHLQGTVDGTWLGNPADQAKLKQLWQAITALLPANANKARPLPTWCAAIAEALQRVYGQSSLDPNTTHGDALIRALQSIGDALREQTVLPDDSSLSPHVTFSQAMTLTLRQLNSATLPEPGGEPAVELMGFLDLAMDDAPLTVVTSLNEGHVPAMLNSDPLLPNDLRRQLGLVDNTRRYARDLLRLRSMLTSRQALRLIASRHNAAGDPLTPSRLLLACDDETLTARVQAFYDPPAPQVKAPLFTPGAHDQFLIPLPTQDEPVLDRLRVTAFADYLACPYRFYLKHVRRLDELNDAHEEMDPLAFGSLGHDVLHRFGQSALCDSDDADAIGEMLSDQLDQLAAARFGRDNSHVAVRLQIEQMRQRLRHFAHVQAMEAAEGWRIVATEREVETTIQVDGGPFTLTGRLDRIDYHPERGYRILDYKTADQKRTPNQTHRGRDANGQPVWRDLQLPLYQVLGRAIHIEGDPALGYFNLPKQQQDTGIALAPWDATMLEDAFATRDWVITHIRDQVFWPPADPPDWADHYTRLCADQAMQRRTLIDASHAQQS